MKKNIIGGIAAAATATGALLFGAAPAQADDGFIMCPSGRDGVATAVTSCPFADDVRFSYFTQDGQVVTAYSPVTGEYYEMQCAGGFYAHFITGMTVRSVRCVGGDNAVVVIW